MKFMFIHLNHVARAYRLKVFSVLFKERTSSPKKKSSVVLKEVYFLKYKLMFIMMSSSSIVSTLAIVAIAIIPVVASFLIIQSYAGHSTSSTIVTIP